MNNILNYGKDIGRYILSTSINILSIFEYIFKYRKFKPLSTVKKDFMNHKQDVSIGNITIFKRLSDAYIKAKMDERNAGQIYQPSYMWKKIINDRFWDLISSIRNNNLVKLRTLLENFHREKFTLGSGEVAMTIMN